MDPEAAQLAPLDDDLDDETENGGSPTRPRTKVVRDASDATRTLLRLSGAWTVNTSGRQLTKLRSRVDNARRGHRIGIDVGPTSRIDGGVLCVLLQIKARGARRAITVELLHLDPSGQALLALLEDNELKDPIKPAPSKVGVFTQVGQSTLDVLASLRLTFDFVGNLVVTFFRSLRRPSTIHAPTVLQTMERAGADGVPIVLLMAFLIGLIMAFQGAIQLKQFGANIFVADLVGLAIVREFGPLLTAIIVAGRSGAGFAAELGTMKVSEEIDALNTLGLDPFGHLVYPRVIGLVLVMPFLVLMADAIGIVGGLLVGMTSLDLTLPAYLNQTQKALELWDVCAGLIKSVFFAGAIALIACESGLSTRGGAEGVGRSTTSAVVTAILYVVVIDSAFTIAYHYLGL
ncbi:MAG: ABC transporter permease [Planctomycetota bacterium]|jgi:phospholipid/cholesterol/gamma-HCH transport system permease protein